MSLCRAQSCDEVWLVTFILLSQQCVNPDRNRPQCDRILCMIMHATPFFCLIFIVFATCV